MKKSFSVVCFAIIAMAFSSCNKEDIQNTIPEDAHFNVTIEAQPVETKAQFGDKVGASYPVLWETQEALFSLDYTRPVSSIATPSSDKKTASFDVEFIVDAKPEGGVILGASPKGDYQSDPVVGGFTSVYQKFAYLVIPSIQTPTDFSVDPTSLPVFGETTYSTSIPEKILMDYKHVLSYCKMTITDFEKDIDFVKVQFPKNVAGSSAKYYHTADGETVKGDVLNLSENEITISASKLTGNTFWFGFAPTGDINTSGIKITVVDKDGGKYSKTLTDRQVSFDSGKVYKFSTSFSGISAETSVSNTWDLTTTSYQSKSASSAVWTSSIAEFSVAKGESTTNVDQSLGAGHSRYYAKSELTFSANPGYSLNSVSLSATSESYANVFTNSGTSIKDGTIEVNGTEITLTPADGASSITVVLGAQTRLTSATISCKVSSKSSLASIALSGDYKTTFNTGDDFVFGGTVTASYDDDSSSDVTSDVTFSGYDLTTAGNQTVTVSYTETGVTKTASYQITVVAAPMLSADNIDNVPASGIDAGEHAYIIENHTDDIIVKEVTGCVTEAICEDGAILYTVGVNYTTTEKKGTIVLVSASDESVTTTITVSQLSSKLTVSATEITIPYNETSATFTITSKELSWNMNVAASTDMDLSTSSTSGDASDGAQTITVSSTTEASTSSVLTLGTIVVYRNNNAGDSQKKTITVKKGQAPGAGAKYYVPVKSITSGGKYLLVYNGKAASGFASKGLTLTDITISDNGILSDATTNSYAITIETIAGADSQYSLKLANNSYVGHGNSGTDVATSTTIANNKYKWTVTFDESSVRFVNVGSTTRYLGINNATAPTAIKAYATSGADTYPCPTLYKLSE